MTKAIDRQAKKINEAHVQALRAAHDALEWAIEAGKLLVEQKERMGATQGRPKKGNTRVTFFKEWIAEHCAFTHMTATRYMLAYRNKDEILAGAETTLMKALATVKHMEGRRLLFDGDEPRVKKCELDIWHGDFRQVAKDAKIAPASIPLIFTDPPYDRESLPLYADLAELASRLLREGGSMLVYCGHYLLPDVINAVTPHLRYWWTCGCRHTGQLARMREYGIVVGWKPIVWFVKDTRGDKLEFVHDLVDGVREKDHHEWQQAEVEAAYFIENLTKSGNTIFEPFCGGGTTCVAAKRLKRKWIAADIDAKAVEDARKRLKEMDDN